MKMVLASKNRHKAEEISSILGESIKIITQDAAGVGDIDVVEDGLTFEENAAKKAETIMKATNLMAIADDSGLCVDALGGRPGVYTARFAGENATDDENISKLLGELSGVPESERTASFVCVIAIAAPGEETKLFRGECKGRIAFEKKGENGFGYDPVFFIPEYNKSMAEIPPSIKNSISHRSNALKKLKDSLGL